MDAKDRDEVEWEVHVEVQVGPRVVHGFLDWSEVEAAATCRDASWMTFG